MKKSPKYKLILTSDKRKKDLIKASSNKNIIYKELRKRLDECDNVVFPIKYLNKEKTLTESNYELLVIKKRDPEDQDSVLRNDLGKFVEHVVLDDTEWCIIDKYPCPQEETFWVYGFHPRFQRKTATEVIDMFITDDTSKRKMKIMLVYKNKLVIKNEEAFNMVICKCLNDSIRLYNYIFEYCKKNKIKNIIYRGNVNYHNYPNICDEIMKETGWNRKKVIRSTTRP